MSKNNKVKYVAIAQRAKAKPAAGAAKRPPSPLGQMRDALADGALHFLAFDVPGEAFSRPPSLGVSHPEHDAAGGRCLRLGNGKADAFSQGSTEGYGIRLPDALEAAASGRKVRVSVVARCAAGAGSRFAIAYSTNEVGNSGWQWRAAGPDWSVHAMDYDVPKMKDGKGDFVGLLPEPLGHPATEFLCLAIRLA